MEKNIIIAISFGVAAIIQPWLVVVVGLFLTVYVLENVIKPKVDFEKLIAEHNKSVADLKKELDSMRVEQNNIKTTIAFGGKR
jgi:hypothetical protein